MAADARQAPALFDPSAYRTFRFTSRELDEHGRVKLGYALDEEIEFAEELTLPLPDGSPVSVCERERVDGLLALLHWVAGVSYFKTALPERVSCEAGAPGPAAAALLEALYSEGLGELAYVNGLPELPRPRFAFASLGEDAAGAPRASGSSPAASEAFGEAPAPSDDARPSLGRVLVPVGGGKDSAVALEIVRRSGCELALFSLGDAPPIARTVAAAGLPWLLAHRTLDPRLRELNAAGAINGHVPVTAIVSCVALLTAALNGFDAVAMANERSASAGNVMWDGVEVNHQFSKGLRAERLLAAAAAEAGAAPRLFSVLRPASELAIARAFARMERYHGAFGSCNAIFRSDPALRVASWCCDCPKCRFVFLVLAPFSEPAHLREVFGVDLLDEEAQYEGFALLTATGGHKPFECVGEEQESLAAIGLLAADERWRGHAVVRRLVAEVLPRQASAARGRDHAAGDPDEVARDAGHAVGDPDRVLTLSDDHDVPPVLLAAVHAVLGA
jgi:UDP-N-acetyl-alpha-D-muramoyl-L-alanyl-L-glutamate epimerase